MAKLFMNTRILHYNLKLATSLAESKIYEQGHMFP